jgi:hypothetical protein
MQIFSATPEISLSNRVDRVALITHSGSISQERWCEVHYSLARRRGRLRGGNAQTLAARRSGLLGIDRGEQFLHRACRWRTERFVQMDCRRKLLAD